MTIQRVIELAQQIADGACDVVGHLRYIARMDPGNLRAQGVGGLAEYADVRAHRVFAKHGERGRSVLSRRRRCES